MEKDVVGEGGGGGGGGLDVFAVFFCFPDTLSVVDAETYPGSLVGRSKHSN